LVGWKKEKYLFPLYQDISISRKVGHFYFPFKNVAPLVKSENICYNENLNKPSEVCRAGEARIFFNLLSP